MKGLLRKDLYLMIKYCRVFFFVFIFFFFINCGFFSGVFMCGVGVIESPINFKLQIYPQSKS